MSGAERGEDPESEPASAPVSAPPPLSPVVPENRAAFTPSPSASSTFSDDDDDDDDDVDISDEDEEDDEPKTKTITKTVWDWELLNDSKAIWLRSASEVDAAEYEKFYKALAKEDRQRPVRRVIVVRALQRPPHALEVSEGSG